jgi:hypothetical protein
VGIGLIINTSRKNTINFTKGYKKDLIIEKKQTMGKLAV